VTGELRERRDQGSQGLVLVAVDLLAVDRRYQRPELGVVHGAFLADRSGAAKASNVAHQSRPLRVSVH